MFSLPADELQVVGPVRDGAGSRRNREQMPERVHCDSPYELLWKVRVNLATSRNRKGAMFIGIDVGGMDTISFGIWSRFAANAGVLRGGERADFYPKK